MKYIFLLLLLSSCIFESVDKNLDTKNIEVVIKNINEPSFIIKQDLERKFNFIDGTPPDYKIIIDANYKVTNSTIANNASSATKTVEITAKYSFIEVKTGKVFFSSTVSNSNNFTSKSNQITADMIQTKQLIKNLSKDLAFDIYNNIKENSIFRKQFNYTQT